MDFICIKTLLGETEKHCQSLSPCNMIVWQKHSYGFISDC